MTKINLQFTPCLMNLSQNSSCTDCFKYVEVFTTFVYVMRIYSFLACCRCSASVLSCTEGASNVLNTALLYCCTIVSHAELACAVH